MSDAQSQKPKEAKKSEETNRRKPGCLTKLAVVCVSIVVSLLLAEVVIRMFADEVLPNPIGPRHLFQKDDVIGISLKPGFKGRFALYGEFDVPVEINSRGCRDREFGAKKPGVKRILSLSDSFGFGYGVAAEDTYAKVLESRLNRESASPRYEVLNAGASGQGILHMIEILRRTKDWYQPDVVLASFFYVNDLLDIETFPEHTVRGGIVLVKGVAANVDRSPWLQFCFNYSDLALLMQRVYLNMTTSLRLGQLTPPSGVWGTHLIQVAAKPGDEAAAERIRTREATWQKFESHLATLRRETEAAGAKLVLFAIPQEYQTRDEIWAKMKQDGQVDDALFDRHVIGKKLTAICQRVGVLFCDLVPGFAATPPKQTRFFPLNKHFNEEGNAFTALLLEQFLAEKGLL